MRAQSRFPWLIRGADFDNDSAFMNDIVVPWCRAQKMEVTRSRAYKKNDQAFVEQKNGAVVRRLVGYGRFDGIETAGIMARLYAAARLHVNFFQPSFKLKEKRRRARKSLSAITRRRHRMSAHWRIRSCPRQSRVGCVRPIAVSIEWRCSRTSARRSNNSASVLAIAVSPQLPHLRSIRSLSSDPSVASPKQAKCVRRIALASGLTRANPHAFEARSVSSEDRNVARSRASAHRARHCPPTRRDGCRNFQ